MGGLLGFLCLFFVIIGVIWLFIGLIRSFTGGMGGGGYGPNRAYGGGGYGPGGYGGGGGFSRRCIARPLNSRIV